MDRSRALEALAASVPPAVRQVCETLSRASHRALTVGGAVRDALLGRVPGDWDVTTSAMPDEVVALFQHTVPTGIEHGTVTVMAGSGAEHMPIEVTTFRGDGSYSDARRPDEVVFGVSLEEDLARRDFVINALAFDPLGDELFDPFGGFDDIEAGIIRAVGAAEERFTEDGLRVMRAVRFVAVLDFELAAATEAALAPALPSLAQVAPERIRVELLKLLGGPAAMRALDIAHRHRVLETALPITAELDWPTARAAAAAVGSDAVLRLAALLLGASAASGAPAVEKALRELTLSNSSRKRIAIALSHMRADDSLDDGELRALIGDAGRQAADDLIALWRALELPARADRARAIVSAGDALVIGDLAVRGKDVMDVLGIGPSRKIGEVLKAMLAAVHRDPSLNTRDRLMAMITELATIE